MNKDFFKITDKINLLDILKILEISKNDLVIEKDSFVLFPEKIFPIFGPIFVWTFLDGSKSMGGWQLKVRGAKVPRGTFYCHPQISVLAVAAPKNREKIFCQIFFPYLPPNTSEKTFPGEHRCYPESYLKFSLKGS